MLQVEPPAESLTCQDEVIALRIVAAQRQLQPALARQRSVARSGIAADPRHDGNDVVGEAHRLLLGRRLRREQPQNKRERRQDAGHAESSS